MSAWPINPPSSGTLAFSLRLAPYCRSCPCDRHEQGIKGSHRTALNHVSCVWMTTPRGCSWCDAPCSGARTGDRRWSKPPSWTANPSSGDRLCSFHGLPDCARPRPSRCPLTSGPPPGLLPPASLRSTLSSPLSPCACLSVMHQRDRPGEYGVRNPSSSQPPQLRSLTREDTSVGPRTKIVNRGSPRPVFSFACVGQPDQIVNL